MFALKYSSELSIKLSNSEWSQPINLNCHNVHGVLHLMQVHEEQSIRGDLMYEIGISITDAPGKVYFFFLSNYNSQLAKVDDYHSFVEQN